MIAGLGLLFLATDSSNGAIKQSLGERKGWQVELQISGHDDHSWNKTIWTIDEQEAKKQILEPYKNVDYSINIDKITPVSDVVTASQVLFYLKQQIGNTNSAATNSGNQSPQYAHSPKVQLALADVMERCGQMDKKELSNLYLEIAANPNVKSQDKASLLIDGSRYRLAQYLADCYKAKNPELAKRSIDRLINNQILDHDIRALALATLKASSIATERLSTSRRVDETPRMVALASLEKGWQSTMNKTASTDKISTNEAASKKGFAQSYLTNLLDQLQAGTKRSEQFEAAKTVLELQKAAIVNLATNQKQLVFNTLLRTSDITHAQMQLNTASITDLNMNPKDRTIIQEATDLLADNIDQLSQKQIQQLKKNSIDILNLPNQKTNKADPSRDLKLVVIRNIAKIITITMLLKACKLLKSLKKISKNS